MKKSERPWWRHPNLGQRHEIDLPQGRLAYFDSGAGEPIVLVHGACLNANVFYKIVPILSKKYRCITPDLPYGAHELPMPNAEFTLRGLADLTIQTMEAIGLERVTLVGNDGGSPVAQVAAMTRPDLVAGLSVSPGGAFDDAPPPRLAPHFWVARNFGTRRLLIPMRIRALRGLPLAFGQLAIKPIDYAISDTWFLPAMASRAIDADATRMFRTLNPDCEYTNWAAEHFANFHKPVLVAWAKKDLVFPGRMAERFAKAFPNVRLEWIHDARSFLPLDQPEIYAGLIADLAQRGAEHAAGSGTDGARLSATLTGSD